MCDVDNDLEIGEDKTNENTRDKGGISVSTYVIFSLAIFVILTGLFMASYKSGIVGPKNTVAHFDFSSEPAGTLVPLETKPDTMVVREETQLFVHDSSIVYYKAIGNSQIVSVELRFRKMPEITPNSEIPEWAGPILAVSIDGARLAFAICADDIARVYYIDPEEQKYHEIAQYPFDVNENETYLVEAVFNTKGSSFAVNGKEIIRLEDSALNGFKFGRFAGIEAYGCSVYFDNLTFK